MVNTVYHDSVTLSEIPLVHQFKTTFVLVKMLKISHGVSIWRVFKCTTKFGSLFCFGFTLSVLLMGIKLRMKYLAQEHNTLPLNGIARTLKKLRTSKGDFCIKQWF